MFPHSVGIKSCVRPQHSKDVVNLARILTTRLTFYCLILGYTLPLLSVTAFAQGFQFSLEIANPNPVGSGARALGQGNAFIAVADDATAASWNPGGLAQLERPEFSFALETVAQEMRLRSHTHPESEGKDSFHLEDFNYASLVFPFHLGRNMVVSLNYLKLFRFDKEMNFTVNQRTDDLTIFDYDFDQQGSFSVLAPAFGFDLTPRLSLGITVNIWNHDITNSSRFKKKEFTRAKFIFSDGSEADDHLFEKNEIEIDEGYSVVIGGLYRLNKYWAFGAVIKPAFELELNHEITINSFNELQDAELEMPMILGAGAAWRPSEQLTVSTDITWTNWSKYQFIQNAIEKNPLTGERSSEDELEDTFTLRMGCEYLLIRKNYIIPLRCGVGYDPAPAVDRVDDFFTVNVGTGIQLFERVNFDIGYEFRWGNNVNNDILRGIDGRQDIHRHRLLASMIVYF